MQLISQDSTDIISNKDITCNECNNMRTNLNKYMSFAKSKAKEVDRLKASSNEKEILIESLNKEIISLNIKINGNKNIYTMLKI